MVIETNTCLYLLVTCLGHMLKQQVCQVFSNRHFQSLFQVTAWTYTFFSHKKINSLVFNWACVSCYLSMLLIFWPASFSSVLLRNVCACLQHWDTCSVRYSHTFDRWSSCGHASSVHFFRSSASSWPRDIGEILNITQMKSGGSLISDAWLP